MRRIRKHGKTTEKKTDRTWQEAESRMEKIRVCDVEKYYGSDTNITKAVDRVAFASKKENLWESWEHRVPERQHF